LDCGYDYLVFLQLVNRNTEIPNLYIEHTFQVANRKSFIRLLLVVIVLIRSVLFLLSIFVIIGFFRDGVISPVPNPLTSEGYVLVANAYRHPVLPITVLHQPLSPGSPSGLFTTNLTQKLTLPANATRRLKEEA
jgi:hypothetical protein